MKKLLPLLLTLPLLSQERYEPLLLGTPLAYFYENVPPGQCIIEPYLFIGTINGIYNSQRKVKPKLSIFSEQLINLVDTGITPWLDITLLTQQNYTTVHNKHSFHYGDTRLALGFEISKDTPDSWIPAFRLLLQESFPTGKYQNLNPHKHLADVTGSGAYETWLIAVVRKLFYPTPRHPMTANLTLQYDIPTSVHTHHYNLYGGTATSHGSVTPGNQFIGNLGLEYSLTYHLSLCLDIHYIYQSRSRSHHRFLRSPSADQFSLAPTLEYNTSPNFGFEIGPYFTVTGRNAFSFINSLTTVYWLF